MIGLLERTAVRDWRAVTAQFFAATALEAVAIGHLTAFTPLFLGGELGLSPEEVGPWTGFLAAGTFAVAFPLAPLWGSLAERYTRKLIIVRSMYIEAVGYALCAWAPDLGWFLAARILLGLTFGNVAVIMASLSLLTPERRMGSAIAAVLASAPVAVSLGPPIGALVIPWLGLRGLFAIDAAGCLIAALLITFLMPEPPRRGPLRSVLGNLRHASGVVFHTPALRLNFVAWYLTRGAMSVLETYLPVRIAELAAPNPAAAIGLILGVNGAITTVATGLVGRLVDRVGAARLFWPAMLAASVASIGVAGAGSLWMVAASEWARAITVALTSTVLYAHLTSVLGKQDRAAVLSLTPVPRNFAAFSLPLAAAFAAGISTTAALTVGAIGYGAAAWVGRRMLRATPDGPPSRSET